MLSTETMFNIALYEPKIPQNTGNIIRLAANTGCRLHLIEPLGFNLEEKNVRRSGLDYADLCKISCHASYADFSASLQQHRLFAFTTKGLHPYNQVRYQPGDVLLFGSETAGLPTSIHQALATNHRLRIPMHPNNRSLNLANAVAIVTYEAWRQQGFDGGQ